MKESVRQRDLYCAHYAAVFHLGIKKDIVVRGSPRQTAANSPLRKIAFLATFCYHTIS
jgi:hypothetical protein